MKVAFRCSSDSAILEVERWTMSPAWCLLLSVVQKVFSSFIYTRDFLPISFDSLCLCPSLSHSLTSLLVPV